MDDLRKQQEAKREEIKRDMQLQKSKILADADEQFNKNCQNLYSQETKSIIRQELQKDIQAKRSKKRDVVEEAMRERRSELASKKSEILSELERDIDRQIPYNASNYYDLQRQKREILAEQERKIDSQIADALRSFRQEMEAEIDRMLRKQEVEIEDEVSNQIYMAEQELRRTHSSKKKELAVRLDSQISEQLREVDRIFQQQQKELLEIIEDQIENAEPVYLMSWVKFVGTFRTDPNTSLRKLYMSSWTDDSYIRQRAETKFNEFCNEDHIPGDILDRKKFFDLVIECVATFKKRVARRPILCGLLFHNFALIGNKKINRALLGYIPSIIDYLQSDDMDEKAATPFLGLLATLAKNGTIRKSIQHAHPEFITFLDDQINGKTQIASYARNVFDMLSTFQPEIFTCEADCVSMKLLQFKNYNKQDEGVQYSDTTLEILVEPSDNNKSCIIPIFSFQQSLGQDGTKYLEIFNSVAVVISIVGTNVTEIRMMFGTGTDFDSSAAQTVSCAVTKRRDGYFVLYSQFPLGFKDHIALILSTSNQPCIMKLKRIHLLTSDFSWASASS